MKADTKEVRRASMQIKNCGQAPQEVRSGSERQRSSFGVGL